MPEAAIRRGTERGYPDLEISGAAFGGGHHAIDVKAARRARNLTQTQSRITLYTGNTYFRWPDLHWPGTFRPFNEYASHLDLILIYTLNESSNARVEDLEVIVQEPWRIASRERSSTTREYIGAVTGIAALRAGQGVFETPAAFYDYWRRFPFKVSPQVQNQLQRLLASAQQELAVLRRQQQPRPEDEPTASSGSRVCPVLSAGTGILSCMSAEEGVAISLFSGAGGLDLGVEQAGYAVRAAVEWDRDAAATMEKNFTHLHSPVLQKSILDTPDGRDPRSCRAPLRGTPGPAGRRPALHAVLQVRVLA